ncbi:hypothetical protein ABZ553_27725 [Streptomyces sparsogenes]|uniref:hypothetical protein n=1 Tax=Streptomyces sparsogenes TaxID=67365 RepID=UPI0033F0B9AB
MSSALVGALHGDWWSSAAKNLVMDLEDVGCRARFMIELHFTVLPAKGSVCAGSICG